MAERWTHETVFVVAADQVSSELDGEVAILDLKDGVYYGLNATGSTVWGELSQPASLAHLRDTVTREFAVASPVAERDLRVLLRQLVKVGLVQVVSQHE
jgi:hypothetical protein